MERVLYGTTKQLGEDELEKQVRIHKIELKFSQLVNMKA